jgi:hypothetical protein
MDGTGGHLKQSYSGSEGQKLHVLPHMWIIDLKQIQQYYRTQVTLGECMGGIGQEKETEKLNVADVLTV